MAGKIRDLTGQAFGELMVLERAPSKRLPCGALRTRWKCKCSCGNIKIMDSGSLTSHRNKTCGANVHRRGKGDPAYSHGMSGSRLYQVWNAMKNRCNNSNAQEYDRYGGRGIRVCEEWNKSFQSFYEWAMENGYQPSAKRGECTLDRIDNDKGYCPENCRWTSAYVQNRNKSTNKYITHAGRTQVITDWAKEFGVTRATIANWF